MGGNDKPAACFRREVKGTPTRKHCTWYVASQGQHQVPSWKGNPVDRNRHRRTAGSRQRARWQPAQLCCLFPMPPDKGAWPSVVQPVRRERRLVRGEIQNDNRNWKDTRGRKRRQMGVESNQGTEIAREAKPESRDSTGNKEKCRCCAWPFHPGLKHESDDLAGQFGRGEPHRKAIKALTTIPRPCPVQEMPWG